MKIIVAGPRTYTNKEFVFSHLDNILTLYKNVYDEIEIVEGGATGVDHIAKDYAEKKGYRHKQFTADWKTQGRAAGPIRNKKMADYSDILIAFYNGSLGTSNMIKQALEKKLNIHILQCKQKEDTTCSK